MYIYKVISLVERFLLLEDARLASSAALYIHLYIYLYIYIYIYLYIYIYIYSLYIDKNTSLPTHSTSTHASTHTHTHTHKSYILTRRHLFRHCQEMSIWLYIDKKTSLRPTYSYILTRRHLYVRHCQERRRMCLFLLEDIECVCFDVEDMCAYTFLQRDEEHM
jgi:hypothetical protein